MRNRVIAIESVCDFVDRNRQVQLLGQSLAKMGDARVVTCLEPSQLEAGYLNQYSKENRLLKNQESISLEMARATARKQELERQMAASDTDKDSVLLFSGFTANNLGQATINYQEDLQRIEIANDIKVLEFFRLGLPCPLAEDVIFLTGDFATLARYWQETRAKEEASERLFRYQKDLWASSYAMARKEKWQLVDITDDNGLKSVEEVNTEIRRRLALVQK